MSSVSCGRRGGIPTINYTLFTCVCVCLFGCVPCHTTEQGCADAAVRPVAGVLAI